MTTYIVRRLLIAVPILLGITVLIFLFVALAPGDAVDAYLRPEQAGNQALRDALIHSLGLDQPLPIRYIRWLAETLQGNLGFATITGEAVNSIVWRGLLASGSLMLTAIVIGIVIGIPIGVVGALRQYSKVDTAITAFGFLGIATPSFLAGLGGLYLFGLVFKIFPVGGMQAAAVPFTIPDFIAHLTLPALILGYNYVATFSRYTRSSMLDVISQQYITTAEAKGLPRSRVVFRHAFRNALIPVVTIIGLSLPQIIGGAAVTEWVFSWPGLGWSVINAANQRDFPTIMGISLAFAVVVVLANLLTDVAYAVVDPRIRY
jgi:peptide/nickel transport system permease protein